MRILSIDLAYLDPTDIGLVVLDSIPSLPPRATFIDPRVLCLRMPMSASNLGRALAKLANSCGCIALAIDGPQAWKSPANGLIHSRVCDKRFNAPAKVGVPESAKPETYWGFVSFSVRLFDQLNSLGWPRLPCPKVVGPVTRYAIESLPLAAWKALGLQPLPAKRKCSDETLEQRWHGIESFANVEARPNHDQLQAVMGGLGSLLLVEGRTAEVVAEGIPPFLEEGYWREGFIVCAQRTASKLGVGAVC